MPRFFTEPDIDLELIKSKRVGLLGYGNQGHAHALNLRDSGVSVTVGLYEGSKSADKAREAGFDVASVAEATQQCDVLMLCLPDVPMGHIYCESIEPHLREGHALLFAHGFNIHFGLIEPPEFVDVAMVSPKGPGHGLRSEFLQGSGLPALVALHQDSSGKGLQIALSYAAALGSLRALIFETTFREETVCDLFGEQAVLCGGLVELVKAGFETLVAAGYEPEAAYFECLHETKLIVDLLVTRGLAGMRAAISDTAEWGGYVAGPRVVDSRSREAMKEILAEIEDGEFARRWVQENAAGGKRLAAYRDEEQRHPAESAGAPLRAKMPFLRSWMKSD
jgi:ketol-acid reductoisomerase